MIIVLGSKGHEVLVSEQEDVDLLTSLFSLPVTVCSAFESKVNELASQGYSFWENEATGDAITLGQQVQPNDVVATKNYAAMLPMMGG